MFESGTYMKINTATDIQEPVTPMDETFTELFKEPYNSRFKTTNRGI